MSSEKKDKEKTEAAAPKQPTQQPGAGAKIVWDSADMRSSYANVFNVSGAREEFVFFFGMNQAFDAGQNELKVQLTDRIVMSPFAAKRLATLLNNVIKDYEGKFGKLEVDGEQPANSTAH